MKKLAVVCIGLAISNMALAGPRIQATCIEQSIHNNTIKKETLFDDVLAIGELTIASEIYHTATNKPAEYKLTVAPSAGPSLSAELPYTITVSSQAQGQEQVPVSNQDQAAPTKQAPVAAPNQDQVAPAQEPALAKQAPCQEPAPAKQAPVAPNQDQVAPAQEPALAKQAPCQEQQTFAQDQEQNVCQVAQQMNALSLGSIPVQVTLEKTGGLLDHGINKHKVSTVLAGPNATDVLSIRYLPAGHLHHINVDCTLNYLVD